MRPKPGTGLKNACPGDAIRGVIGPFSCPFCEGNFSASEEPPAVLHSLPVCSQWTALEPHEFLEAARHAREPS